MWFRKSKPQPKWKLLGTLRHELWDFKNKRKKTGRIIWGHIYYYLFEAEDGKRKYIAAFSNSSCRHLETLNFTYADQVVAFMHGIDVSACYHDDYSDDPDPDDKEPIPEPEEGDNVIHFPKAKAA